MAVTLELDDEDDATTRAGLLGEFATLLVVKMREALPPEIEIAVILSSTTEAGEASSAYAGTMPREHMATVFREWLEAQEAQERADSGAAS